jgi:hypothetical protein
LPGNYRLTFSLADGNDASAAAALANGMNVAAVFRDKATVARYVADGFMGRPVFNGDETDLRFLDPPVTSSRCMPRATRRRTPAALFATKSNHKRDNPMDTFAVVGNEIHFGPYRVGTLSASVPASVQANVVDALHSVEDQDEAERREFDRGYEKGHADASAEALSLFPWRRWRSASRT